MCVNSSLSRYITTTVVVVVFFSFLFSCSKTENEKIDAVVDRSEIAGLEADKVTTIISDSGITRYRIYAKDWKVFDKADKPYWEFKDGIYFERFDTTLHIDANFSCNYAIYYNETGIWEFKGKVKATDREGNMVESEELFWNEKKHRIYSHIFVKVTQPTRIVTGIGFDSTDQSLADFNIRKPQAILSIKKEDEEKF